MRAAVWVAVLLLLAALGIRGCFGRAQRKPGYPRDPRYSNPLGVHRDAYYTVGRFIWKEGISLTGPA